MLKDIRFTNRTLLDEGMARYVGPGRRFNCPRKEYALHSGKNTERALKARLWKSGLSFREDAVRVEQHFKNEAGLEEVFFCRWRGTVIRVQASHGELVLLERSASGAD